MDVAVRAATEKDFNAIVALIREFAVFQQKPGEVSITSEQMKDDQALFSCLVAETASGEIIGFATFFFAYYSWSGKAIYLDDLYVSALYRKQGIGKQLLQEVINLARSRQCIKVRWQVSKWNEPAINFYKKMGAVVDDVEINCDFVIR